MIVGVIITLFAWPAGIVVGNLIASILWGLPTWLILLRKLHCSQPWCFRPGRHPIEGTTFHTCQKHTVAPVHASLKALHAEKYPEQHAHLNPVTP